MNFDPEYVKEMLQLVHETDTHGLFYWGCTKSDHSFWFVIPVNDVFAWGWADSEEVEPDEVAALRKAIDDCTAIDSCALDDGCMLFVARKRGMRPQGAAYPDNPELWPLFDACGPEREVGFGNPYRPGEYKPK